MIYFRADGPATDRHRHRGITGLGDARNAAVALFIAVVKALLVILFFMHVRHSSRHDMDIRRCSFLWLGLLLTWDKQRLRNALNPFPDSAHRSIRFTKNQTR